MKRKIPFVCTLISLLFCACSNTQNNSVSSSTSTNQSSSQIEEHHFSSEWDYDENYHFHKCIDEGFEDLRKDEEKHVFTEHITLPTYDSYGFITHECTVCDYSYIDEYINPTSFTYDYGVNAFSPLAGGFELGDFKDGNNCDSLNKMRSSMRQSINYSVSLTTDWTSFTIYIYYHNGKKWISEGWKTSDYKIVPGYTYQFVVGRRNLSDSPLTESEQNEIQNKTGLISQIWAELGKSNAHYPRLMNRQGEGYGYPDNSLEGITCAAKDGYSKIRLSIVNSLDGVFYCSHSYEMENNSVFNYATMNGEIITDDIYLYNCESSYIDALLYKGYSIPRLKDALAELVKYDIEITWELKGTYTNQSLKELVNLSLFYNMKIIFSADECYIDQLVKIREDLNIALIFYYDDSLAIKYKTLYMAKCKKMRFDCYWGDVVSADSLINYIHPDVDLKFGGGTLPSLPEVLETMQWVDVCEVSYRISSLTYSL